MTQAAFRRVPAGERPAVGFRNERRRNTGVARIFPLDRTRAGYISLNTLIDCGLGGLLALPGITIAAT